MLFYLETYLYIEIDIIMLGNIGLLYLFIF